jgi:pimeloyl-ACP methyl ester carboxylesterase
MRPIAKEFYKSDAGNRVAVLFVHGFTGDVQGTWGRIPEFLHAEPKLAGWDLLGFGYQSRRGFDILNLWSADAGLEEISTELQTAVSLLQYDRLALVAHSMGGLVLQRALVRYPELRQRVSQVILFGTPSAGLVKATLASWLKQQIRNMSASGQFIRDLREQWNELERDSKLPRVLAVAGETDQFVPPNSSLGPFPEQMRRVIPGNHISMLNASSANDACVQIIVETLTGGAAAAGPRTADRLAVEEGRFQQAIDRLWPIRAEIDEGAAVSLALALDSLGRREESIQFLEGRSSRGTDVLGVLAGRYKRRWLLERRRADAERALELYRAGYARATAKQPVDREQAFYHGINLAFLELAYGGDYHAAGKLADEVLDHCRESKIPRDALWRVATEADALLILGRVDEAIARHADAAQMTMQPWQALSIQEQALRTADLCGCAPQQIEAIARLYEGGVQ